MEVMEVMGRLKGVVDELAGDYESWETAMAQVNTIVGLDIAGLAELTGKVDEMGKVVPKAREELADGLYQIISNGVPESNWLTFLNHDSKARQKQDKKAIHMF